MTNPGGIDGPGGPDRPAKGRGAMKRLWADFLTLSPWRITVLGLIVMALWVSAMELRTKWLTYSDVFDYEDTPWIAISIGAVCFTAWLSFLIRLIHASIVNRSRGTSRVKQSVWFQANYAKSVRLGITILIVIGLVMAAGLFQLPNGSFYPHVSIAQGQRIYTFDDHIHVREVDPQEALRIGKQMLLGKFLILGLVMSICLAVTMSDIAPEDQQ